ncbi:hypothetical protein [Lysobacter gummosus]|uniref:hypothetical protein n=1 Tax=Lysobacter gummosus TaxID=262324 RepID=UPI00362FEDC7
MSRKRRRWRIRPPTRYAAAWRKNWLPRSEPKPTDGHSGICSHPRRGFRIPPEPSVA